MRLRGECLGAVGSQSLSGCEKDQVNTRENEVVGAGFDNS